MAAKEQEAIKQFRKTPFYEHSRFQEGMLESIEQITAWLRLAKRYDTWLERKRPLELGIPKIIHQIWVGSPIPGVFKELTETWKEKNPEWQHRLWDESAILDLSDFSGKKAFARAKSNGVKSDIARYEILRQFGGVYADTDFECIKPLDSLCSKCTFFAGTIFGVAPGFANGLIGCVPSHPLIQRLCEETINPIKTTEIMDIINATGPGLLTRLYFEFEDKLESTDIMLPSQYFYPLPNFVHSVNMTRAEKMAYVSNESFAIHYWAVSWSKVDFISFLIRKFNRGVKRLRKMLCW